jgi:hypothetical protein
MEIVRPKSELKSKCWLVIECIFVGIECTGSLLTLFFFSKEVPPRHGRRCLHVLSLSGYTQFSETRASKIVFFQANKIRSTSSIQGNKWVDCKSLMQT